MVFAAVTIALAVLLYYTPDYLHLTTNPEKSARWAIKVRWRIIAAVLFLGLLTATSGRSRIMVLAAVAVLLIFNALARPMAKDPSVPLWLWVGDLSLLSAVLLTRTPVDLALAALLFAASAHLAIVASDKPQLFNTIVLVAWSLVLIEFFARKRQIDLMEFALFAGLVVFTSGATVWLVHRAKDQNGRNIAAAIRELKDFTGYPDDRIKELWETSNQQLAKNWESAGVAGDDSERLAEWYRQNSQLYLFAISGYNLEYKRIRSNLNVLKMGAGRCLDYGAGNGEVLLELAHRGHAVSYYDVEGETMRFARWRAKQRNLPVEFFRSKDELLAARRSKGYDTIFSLDVLEHLPNLPAELNFLASLLNRGGRMIFDVPAGATKSHPMHLNHNLDVVAHLKARGLQDERTLWQKLPFRKEEKYIFKRN